MKTAIIVGVVVVASGISFMAYNSNVQQHSLECKHWVASAFNSPTEGVETALDLARVEAQTPDDFALIDKMEKLHQTRQKLEACFATHSGKLMECRALDSEVHRRSTDLSITLQGWNKFTSN